MSALHKTIICSVRNQTNSLFRVIRYEDFAKDPTSQSQQVLQFLGFQMHPEVSKFLETHTTQNIGGVSSTFRDSKSAPYHWKKDLSFEEVVEIQSECSDALRLWGYRTYSTREELRDVHPVGVLNLN